MCKPLPSNIGGSLGVVGVVLGAVFVYRGIDKANWMKEAMRVERLTEE